MSTTQNVSLSQILPDGHRGPEALYRQHLLRLWISDCVYRFGLTCFLVCFLMCSGQERITIHFLGKSTKTNHLIIISVTQFFSRWGHQNKWFALSSSLMDFVMHWNVWFNGSDVTNVLFFIHYNCQWFSPDQHVFRLVGFTCQEISKDLWPEF